MAQFDATIVNVSLPGLAGTQRAALPTIQWVMSGYLRAPLLGPVVAGGILIFGSWRWIFLFNLPVGFLAFALAWGFCPMTGSRRVRVRST